MLNHTIRIPSSVDSDARPRLAGALGMACAAGRLLVEHLERRGDTESTVEFKGRRELVTAADKASERLLVAAVRAGFAGDAVLAEEGVSSPKGVADREAEYCWVIDPLDGTTNFVHGHPAFSVSIGILRGGEPWIGVVHAPWLGPHGHGETYFGVVGVGAWCNDRSLHVSSTEALRDAVVATGFSYRRNEPGVNTNLANFGRVLMEVRGIRRCGSAALDLAHVAAGVYDGFWEVYLEPYDVAAGMALVRAAGGEVRGLGSGKNPLRGSEILATNTRITAQLMDLLTGVDSP